MKIQFFVITASIFMAFLILFPIASVGAVPRPQPVLDQEVPGGIGGAHSIVSYSPIGQTFKPSLNRLAYIQVPIGGGVGPIGPSAKAIFTFKLKVMDETGLLIVFRIQSFHSTKEYSTCVWITFDFHDVLVIPGNTYVIWLEIVHYTNGWPMWSSTTPDAYPDGEAILSGTPRPGIDMIFRTYGYSL